MYTQWVCHKVCFTGVTAIRLLLWVGEQPPSYSAGLRACVLAVSHRAACQALDVGTRLLGQCGSVSVRGSPWNCF